MSIEDIRPEIERFKNDYYRVTGVQTEKFICPITLVEVDEFDHNGNQQIIAGHILNHGLDEASRKTVPSFAEVDNELGFIEADLIEFLNLGQMSSEERFGMRRVRDIKVTPPGGKTVDAFIGNESASMRFQKLPIFGKNVFLREDIENKFHKDVLIEYYIPFQEPKIIGSLLKSAYFALFNVFGYYWVRSCGGYHIRRALLEYYTKRKQSVHDSFSHFVDFKSLALPMLNDPCGDNLDSVVKENFLMHATVSDIGLMFFAITCIFRVNGRALTVTVPSSWSDFDYIESYVDFMKFMKDRTFPHKTFVMSLNAERSRIEAAPINFSMMDLRDEK